MTAGLSLSDQDDDNRLLPRWRSKGIPLFDADPDAMGPVVTVFDDGDPKRLEAANTLNAFSIFVDWKSTEQPSRVWPRGYDLDDFPRSTAMLIGWQCTF